LLQLKKKKEYPTSGENEMGYQRKKNEQTSTNSKTDVSWIKKVLENHLHHHFMATIAAWGVALSALVTLAIALLKQ